MRHGLELVQQCGGLPPARTRFRRGPRRRVGRSAPGGRRAGIVLPQVWAPGGHVDRVQWPRAAACRCGGGPAWQHAALLEAQVRRGGVGRRLAAVRPRRVQRPGPRADGARRGRDDAGLPRLRRGCRAGLAPGARGVAAGLVLHLQEPAQVAQGHVRCSVACGTGLGQALRRPGSRGYSDGRGGRRLVGARAAEGTGMAGTFICSMHATASALRRAPKHCRAARPAQALPR
mmetsp:Transcript_19236/g.57550  ORF Transcript_19236/g.57550 Transcript_19236/m.57550 type:complete len:231 (-) Transcript_19236:186-878(-)